MIRIFLVDDHEIVRKGLRDLFESEEGMEVVGEASSAGEALSRVPLQKVDVAVLDVRLGDGDGIELCRELRAAQPELVCMMLTSYADDEALIASVMAGAAGYILKEVRTAELVNSVRRVARGESLLDPTVTKRVIERLQAGPHEDARLASLSAQERKVLDLIALGRTNRQIADELYLAEKTVKNYVSNLLAKLGMKRRTEAAVFAVRAENEHPGH